MGNQYQTTTHLMVSQYLTNIQMSWANTGLPLSNQLRYIGLILVIFWPYTVLQILAQYRSYDYVQTITNLYWTNIGPIWDTGMTVLDQTWHNYRLLPIQDQYWSNTTMFSLLGVSGVGLQHPFFHLCGLPQLTTWLPIILIPV